MVADAPGKFREVGFEMDILSRINFGKIDLRVFDELQLNPEQTGHSMVAIDLDGIASPRIVTPAADLPLDLAFVTRQLLDIVPNPWVAYSIAEEVIERLSERYDETLIRRDLGFIIEYLKKTLKDWRNERAKEVFVDLLNRKEFHFWLMSGCAGSAIPSRIRDHGGHKLRHMDTDELPNRSLFDFAAETFNDTEASVALFMDRHGLILWWLKNMVPGGYSIQGWQPDRVYPDFVAMQREFKAAGMPHLPTVHVVEIKGLHLEGNEDSDYKRELFALCNQYSQPRPWEEIRQEFAENRIGFHFVVEDEWQRVLNAMLSPDDGCEDD